MSKSDEKSGGTGAAKAPRKRAGLRRSVIALLVLAVFILAAGFLVVRTAYFRKKTEAYIAKKTGLAVTIEGTSLGWPCSLVIEGLKTVPASKDALAGLTVSQVRIEPGFGMKKLVCLDHVVLTLVKHKDGGWEPGLFAGLGELRKLDQVAPVTEVLRREMRLKIVRGRILWLNSDGRRIGALQDFDYSLESVTTGNGRRIYYCSLTAGEMTRDDGLEKRNINADWILTEDNRSIEVVVEEQEGFRGPGAESKKTDRTKQR